MINNPILSIITPTYNRAKYLIKCYESLKRQTNQNFEWIIVDDGSEDLTKDTVNEFINLSPDMNIQYIYKKNGGKHTAMNTAHPFIHGNYVLILDSDDYLIPKAVELVLKNWDEFKKDNSIGTLIFLRGDVEGKARAYGEQNKTPGDFRKLKRINVTSSDCCEVFRADLFIRYPYSVFSQEHFLSESELWNRLAEDNFKCVYINEVIYICEYLKDGLTDSGRKMRIKNPLGGMCTSEHMMHKEYPLKIRFKKGLLYVCYGFFASLSPGMILKKDKGNVWIKILCMIPGYYIYRNWTKKYQ